MTQTFKRIGIIDVGSSALKYAIYDHTPSGPKLFKESNSHATYLGRGLAQGGALDPEARNLSLEVFSTFLEEFAELKAECRLVIATEAVRRTSDREAFLEELRQLAGPGVDVRCISFADEAAWSYLSAWTSLGPLDPNQSPYCAVDPGGSSNDFAWGRQDRAEEILSMPFGMNQLMALVPPEQNDGRLSQSDLAKLREFLDDQYRDLDQLWGDQPAPKSLFATSGAVLALASWKADLKDPSRQSRLMAVHGYFITMADCLRATAEMAELSAAERRERYPCLPAARAMIFCQGALIYERLLARLGLDCVQVNGYGTKLGALVNLL